MPYRKFSGWVSARGRPRLVDRNAKGQLLERPVIIPTPGGVLDGIFLRGEAVPALLVASPHPLLGGSMQNAIVNELAYAAARCGRPSLRFDYRGVGASEGEPSDDPALATEDLAAAFEHLVETTRLPRYALAGYSFGCAPVLRFAAREPRVDRVILVAPPRKTEVPVPDYDAVTVPITVFVGDRDPFVDLALEKELTGKHAPRTRLEVVREGDHALRNGLVELCRATERALGFSRSS